VNRRQHYTSVGKYLRAVEKALLVTSAWDTFPAAPPAASPASPAPFPAGSAFATPARSAPTTPLFSPIPFLHEDARRSASRSPPPLALAPAGAPLGDPPAPADSAGVEPRALGLVDEMDDPGPGHMSERPTALSSVTTVPDEAALPPVKMEEEEGEDVAGASAPAAKKSRPLFSSLKDRFVASTAEKKEEEECDKMELDEGDNRGDQTAE
jgi:serine/threonine-protein phosphatase 4 regulatory subunit 2